MKNTFGLKFCIEMIDLMFTGSCIWRKEEVEVFLVIARRYNSNKKGLIK